MIATVTASRRPDFWENVLDNISRQTLMPDVSILVRHRTRGRADEWVRRLQEYVPAVMCIDAPDEVELSDVLRLGFDTASENMLAPGFISTMDDDDSYGKSYLAEVAGMFEAHPDASIVGKQRYLVRWRDGRFPDQIMYSGVHPEPHRAASVAGPTISVNVEAYRRDSNLRHPVGSLSYADSGLIMAAHAGGHKIYTTSEDNFYLQRYPASHGHGWAMPDPRG